MNTFEICWICPKCGIENLDDYEFSGVPMCSGCDEEHLWDDVLASNKIKELNDLLIERERAIV